MTLPGHHIRRWVSRVFGPLTMARVIDPMLADLQLEYARAQAAGRPWRARWIQFSGYVTCLRALAFHISQSLWSAARNPAVEDRRLAYRVILTSTICLLLVTTLFAGIPMVMWFFSREMPPEGSWLTVTLVPQALPRAIPVALAVGIALALGAQSLSRYVVGIVLALALSGAALSFVTLGWVAPVSNRAFREAAAWTGPGGEAEMTLAKLGRIVRAIDAMPQARTVAPEGVARLELAYYSRFALPVASLALGAWLLARRRLGSRFAAASHAAMACGLYFGLLTAARMAATGGAMPALAAIWLPNIVFFAAAAALAFRSQRTACGV